MLTKNKIANLNKTNSTQILFFRRWVGAVILFSSASTWAGPVTSGSEKRPAVSSAEKLVTSCIQNSPEIASLAQQNLELNKYIFGTLAQLAQMAKKEYNQKFIQEAVVIFDSQKVPKYGPVRLGEFLRYSKAQAKNLESAKTCGAVKTAYETSVEKGLRVACQMVVLLGQPAQPACAVGSKQYFMEI